MKATQWIDGLSKAMQWIDGLSKVPQILAWIGVALVIYLVVFLVCILTDTPTFSKTIGAYWVMVVVTSGYTGSTIRNHKKGLT